MSAWSPEIANEFVRLAIAEGRPLDQLKLQELVYIAHGWCLAATGEPLTGDRPEALAHGPEYRRLSQLLAPLGLDAITEEIGTDKMPTAWCKYVSELDQTDRDWVERIYTEYGDIDASKLAGLTRREGTPWEVVFAGGSGEFREISHALIKAQFVELSQRFTR